VTGKKFHAKKKVSNQMEETMTAKYEQQQLVSNKEVYLHHPLQ